MRLYQTEFASYFAGALLGALAAKAGYGVIVAALLAIVPYAFILGAFSLAPILRGGRQ